MIDFLRGLVRRANVSEYTEGVMGRPALNNRGEWLMSQGLPPKSELVRMGQTWSCVTPAANHFAPVAAMPTTLANIVLFNGQPAGGKSLLIDAVFAVADTSIAAAGVITLLGQQVASGTAPTDNTAVLINSRAGKTYAGLTKRAIANTAFAIADKWEVLGPAVLSSATTTIGLAAYAECYGGWVIPPGGFFLANLIAGTAGGTCVQGVVWHEAQLPIAA